MRKRWFCEVQWFKRRWPIFSIGFANGEFILRWRQQRRRRTGAPMQQVPSRTVVQACRATQPLVFRAATPEGWRTL